MSTVSERQARRIGKLRERRQWDAVMRSPSGIAIPYGAEVRFIPPDWRTDPILIEMRETYSRVLDEWKTFGQGRDEESDLDPIVDRRIAESKIARPWWRFW